MPSLLSRLRGWAARLARELAALALAYRNPRTPLAARIAIALVLAYALSPIDLIPDAIPVLGLVDDLVILPLGIALAIRLLPADVLRDARAASTAAPLRALRRQLGRAGTLAIVALWLLLAVGLVLTLVRRLA